MNHRRHRAVRAIRVRAIRAFTLIEVIVTIAVVILLVSLTAYVSIAVVQRSEVSRTQNTIRLLAQAVEDWERLTDRQVTYRASYDTMAPPGTYDVDFTDPQTTFSTALAEAAEFTNRFFEFLERAPEVRETIARVDSARVKREATTNRLQFFDTWDNQILVIPPGREHNGTPPSWPRDDDGSIRILMMENSFGIARSRRAFLMSRGPDGKAGDLHLDIQLASLNQQEMREVAEASDNIYSYEPVKKRP
jgi:type II secretory pathway pseudopilin PulG